MFEGDRDRDLAIGMDVMLPGHDLVLGPLILQTDMLMANAPDHDHQAHIAKVRTQLDSGLGDQLMAKCREATSDPFDGKYKAIVAGALMMIAGAKIKSEDMQYLRELVPQMTCNFGFTLAIFDHGFREPGRAQFLAALDHYVPGTPRDFVEMSCFTCGKVEGDVGHALQKCSRCQEAYYCDKVGTPLD